jgi:hypothetical protein
MAALSRVAADGVGQKPLVITCGQKQSFLSLPPALTRIKDLGGTKTHDKTFAVLGGFWHSAA